MGEITAMTKPFAGYDTFASCEAANQDKDDPGAYCGSIQAAVEGKGDTPWLDETPWPNRRNFEAYINDTREDYEGEKMPLEAQVAAMPWFMANGFLEWMHGLDTNQTPVPIGRPVAWRIRDMKVEVRFGVWSSKETGHPQVDSWWETIQKTGTRGTVSITFAPVGRKEFVKDGHTIVVNIPKAWIWSTGWVDSYAASPGSTVNYVSESKAFAPHIKASLIVGDSRDTKDAKTPEEVERLMEELHAKAAAIFEECEGCERRYLDKMKVIGVSEEAALQMLFTIGERFKSQLLPDRNRGPDMSDDGAGSAQTKQDDEHKCPPGQKWDDEKKSCVDSGSAEKSAMEKAIDLAVETALAAKALETGKKPEGHDCPPGYTYSTEKGECVAEDGAPMGAEEAVKALAAELKEVRTQMMRMMADAEARARTDAKAKFEKALQAVDIPADKKTSLLSLFDVDEADIDTDARISKLTKSFEETLRAGVHADVDAAVKQRTEVLEKTLTEVQAKMRQPATQPQSQEDQRQVGQPGKLLPGGDKNAILRFVDEKIGSKVVRGDY